MDDVDKLKKYQKAWEYINEWGFGKSPIISYFVVCTCCERAGLSRDEVDLNEFQKIFECRVQMV